MYKQQNYIYSVIKFLSVIIFGYKLLRLYLHIDLQDTYFSSIEA